MLNRRKFLIGSVTLVVWPISAAAREAKWARHITLNGVPNLSQVTPNLFRSAQPTSAGFKALENELNVQTVISLRDFHSDADLLTGTKIERQSVPMNAWHITSESVVAALKLVKAAEARGPVLLHCQHGADRTGVVVAMYRIIFQDWTKEQALDEPIFQIS
jgi:protein tyrosine/serine phosphatase